MKGYVPVLLILAAGALHAQSGEFWAEGGASILANSNIGSPLVGGNQSDVKLDSGFRVSFRLDHNTSGNLGHELQYAYNRSRLSDATGVILPEPGSDGMAIHQVGYNLLYHFKLTTAEAKIRPFITGGVQVVSYSTPASATPQGGSPRFGFNYGGGVKYRISQLWAWRFDLRGYTSGKPNWNGVLHSQSGLLQQFESSAGIGVYF